jgi:hypothetical protein
MSLIPYLKEGAFDPPAIEAMDAAFADVCAQLTLTRQDDPFTQIVARQVIDIGGMGERDPKRIAELVLLAIAQLDQRSA